TKHEIYLTVKSAYSKTQFGTAQFVERKLVDKETNKEVVFDDDIYDIDVRPKDVIYGIDCKKDALNLYRNGFEKVLSTGCYEIDKHFKFKKGELTLLTGIGNYGKSTFMKFLLLIQAL